MQVHITVKGADRECSSLARHGLGKGHVKGGLLSQGQGLGGFTEYLGHVLFEKKIGACMLTGLDIDYNSIVTSLTTKSEPVRLNDAYAHLFSFDIRHEQNQAVMQANSTTCNYREDEVVVVEGKASKARGVTNMNVKDKDQTTKLQTSRYAKCATRWDMLLSNVTTD